MKPAPFTLHRATSIAHAVDMLARYTQADQEAKVIGGGQSLTALMNLRLARPDHLIDVTGVPELHRIVDDAQGVRIGAMVTQAEALADPAVALEVPLLSAAIAHIGHTHIRNRGTIGGSIAHADPAAELPVVALALDAEIVAVGPGGRRSITARDFFDGPFMTALEASDLLVDVVVAEMQPTDEGGQIEWGFEELARRDGDFAMVVVATVVWRDADGRVTDARVALGGVAATPIRSEAAESELIGSVGDAAAVSRAAAAAAAAISPTSDVHASGDYR
ncbi:MAG: xanthine dehydrogenase family protein subunit M, partial [Actinomycetota bacterium]|nr:xanthine dehydrogenase family protein subunit M [Actinomycetota bacterium]